MSGEWGPWIEHHGKGCPVPVGTLVLIEDRAGRVEEVVAGCSEGGRFVGPHGATRTDWLWGWALFDNAEIIRYRVRKPRALQMLRDIAASPEREKELANVD